MFKAYFLHQYFLALACLCFISDIFSQNLVPNPSFESITSCSFSYGAICDDFAPPWECGNLGSSDLFNACSIWALTGVPNNLEGTQYAHSGDGYAGILAKWVQINRREYLLIPLTSALSPGALYYLSFYISLGEDAGCGIQQIGAYFSQTSPYVANMAPLDVVPQIETNYGFLDDQVNWTLISGCYQAQGGEAFLTIGNFHTDAETPLDPNCTGSYSYYYIDDVSLTEGFPPEELPLELGGPVTVCSEYLIDPGIDGVGYLWDDGSTGQSLLVNESGNYALTITNGCTIGIDSIDIIIEGSFEPVEIGVDEVTICSGEEFEISLDPEWNYQWSNGSTGPNITLTSSGLYQVTMDDGCDFTIDSITVLVVAPPVLTLGDDTTICSPNQIEFNFDPSAGNYVWQDNSTLSNYIINTSGTFGLTITNMCGEVSDELVVTILEVPEVNLGDDFSICQGEWSELILDPTAGEFLWHDGSTESMFLVTASGLYTVMVSNECGITSDAVVVEEVPYLSIYLGDDVTICPSLLPYTLDAGNASGASEYIWQNGSTDPIIDVVQSGTYSVTVSNSCFSSSDEIEVHVEEQDPIVILPSDQVLCAGDTIILFNEGSSGEYTWHDSSNDETFLVTTEGTYSLTVTNECGAGVDSVTINFIQPLEVPDLGSDLILCPGERIVLYANAPGSNYTWQDQSTADSLLISTAGTYWLQITNECSTVSDTIEVSIDDNPPDVVLPSNITICSGSTFILDAVITGVQYLWNDSTQNSSISITDPGVYSVTVSNACGIDADTVVVVDGGPAPNVSLPENLSLCPGETILLAPVSSDVISWLWQNGSTASSYNATSEGLITVEVSNDCGAAFDTTIVTLLPPPPILDLGSDTSLCPGELLTLSITVPDVDIEWSDGTTGNSLNVHDEVLVYATISNQCGSSIDSLNVSLLPPPPVLDLGTDQSLCPGETITLSPGITDVDYIWQDGSTTTTYQTTLPGTIILTVSNECGMSTDTLLVFEDTDGPEVDLGEDILACEGEFVTLNAGISGVNYLWQDGSTSSQMTTSISGIFILHVSNACGEDVDTISVEINGIVPTPDLGPDTMLCEGFTLQLVSEADAITSIEWQDGSTQPEFIVSSPGMYILSESNHCGDAADTISIDYTAVPQPFELGSDTILCPSSFIILNAPPTNDLITWQDGSHSISMIADQEQTYSLQISNVCGNVFDDLEVSFDDRVPVIDLDPVVEICQGEVITLDATQSFEAGYLWNTGSIHSSLQVNTPGIYAVNVTTLCAYIQQNIEVVTGKECHDDIYIPSVFSPNGDHINDEWIITTGSGLDIISVQCNIFDRWGNMVFDTRSVPVVWDGRLRGEFMLPGVYAYVLRVEYWEGNEQQSQVLFGDVTVIR